MSVRVRVRREAALAAQMCLPEQFGVFTALPMRWHMEWDGRMMVTQLGLTRRPDHTPGGHHGYSQQRHTEAAESAASTAQPHTSAGVADHDSGVPAGTAAEQRVIRPHGLRGTQYSMHSNVKLFSKAFITTQVNTCTHAIMPNA